MERGDEPLDADVRRTVPGVLAGVGAVYLVLAIVTPLLPGEAEASPFLLGRWLAFAALGLAGGAAARRWPVPRGWGNATVGLAGLLVIGSALLLVAERGPGTVFALLLAVVGFPLFLRSLPWTLVLCVGALAGWTALALEAGGGPAWTPRGLGVLAACGLSLVLQATRVRLLRDLERMKALDADRVARQHELERGKALSEQRRALLRATAHELATPLTPVLLDADLVGRHDLPPEARRQWERLHRNLERLRQAIGRAIAVAKADDDLEAGEVLGPDSGRLRPKAP